jgi:NOL1/NOP2/sun family putative RNA methylase
MRNTYFPRDFLDKYSALLGSEWKIFFETIQKKQPKAFWVNTNKGTILETIDSLKKDKIEFKQLPFHEQAFGIEVTAPGQLLQYRNGFISIQEKAAMLPAVALNPSKEDYVLDACAAPGMKTIQLSNLAGKVLACDVHSKRFEVLKKTIDRFSLLNVEGKRIDFRNLKQSKQFDKILLDAPCSSEGLVRKKREALLNWSPRLVQQKSAIQKNLITKAFEHLRLGGEMVYATCSFSPEENEEVVKHLLQKKPEAEVIPVKLEGIKIRKNEACENCVRLYPQDNDTQQFFFAKIRKN